MTKESITLPVLIWTIVSALLGIGFSGLGIPLYLEKVPPNSVYGFRTSKTLSSPELWYSANRVMGRDLIIAGFCMCIAAVVLAYIYRTSTKAINLGNTLVLVLALSAVAIHGFIFLSKL